MSAAEWISLVAIILNSLTLIFVSYAWRETAEMNRRMSKHESS